MAQASARVRLPVSPGLQVSVIGCRLPVSPGVIPSSISRYLGTIELRVRVPVFIRCLVSSLCHGAPVACQCATKCILWLSDGHSQGCIGVASHARRPMLANVSMPGSPGVTCLWHFACWACPCGHQSVSHHEGRLSLAPFGFLAACEMPAMAARLAAGSRPASPWLPMRSGSRGGPAVGPARAPGPAWTEARCVARCGCVFGPPTGLPLSAGCALILASAYVRPGLASWGVRLSLWA